MSDELRIGTLLRLTQMTAEMIAFLKSAGLETSQIARASDDWMNGTVYPANRVPTPAPTLVPTLSPEP